MADKQAKTEAAPQPAKAGGGLMNKLIIAGFMGGVVMVECALAYFLIPSADQVAALAEQNLQKKLPASLAGEGGDDHGSSTKPCVEVDLGEYSVTITHPSSPTAMRVDFHLVGTVESEEMNHVKEAFDQNVHRFRDMVISEIRHLETTDLADPGLGLIKRRILEKSNELFGKPLLKSVVFPDFSYIEQ
jgi:flagellar FliL protein